MKRVRFIVIALLFSAFTRILAQEINWNSAPQTGFVFQITNNEAQKLLTKSLPDTIINALLHTQIDTFNVKKGWQNKPSKGHFILVRIIENKLHCEYTSVFPYQVLLLKEYNALSLQVLDHDGNVREDAKVKFKTRKIRFDKESKAYRIENGWFNFSTKIVTVELEGFRSVFNVEKHEVPSWSHDYNSEDDGPAFYSYMITDKNRYKPGERVRFKSYALSGSRNALRKDLEIWLINTGRPLKLGTVSPHRPGSFAGEFFLHDSLKLRLDQHYAIQLWEKKGRVVSNCSFKYEEYELHGNKLEVKLEAEKQFHPASNFATIKATSENGLMLKDARATIVVLTENIRETFEPLVILPDTLLRKEISLDPDEPTIVEIPSALFRKSNTTYHVLVSVLNSQNQRMERHLSAIHYFSQYELVAKYSRDSILYELLKNGEAMQNEAVKIYRDGRPDGTIVTLPHREKINPAIRTVKLESAYASKLITMEHMLPKISFMGGIKKDSFNISIENPQKIQLSWYIYQGSLLLEKGFGDKVDFKSKIEDRTQTYYVELLYSFGGSDHITSKGFPFKEGVLNIELDIPDRVYPGQQVEATIAVTDEAGNAMSGVDLTAMATTSKLNYHLPDLPYYGSYSPARSDQATYSKHSIDKRTAILDLDYNKWAPLARLDTMRYYQFTYPGKRFFFYQQEIGDSTQFSGYVMKDGVAKKVYVIEIDRGPAYYSWTDQPKGYSFYVMPEKRKQVTLRLYDRVIILDSMCFDRGKKTIFSLDLDNLPKGTRIHHIAPEIVRLSKKRKRPRWTFTSLEITRHLPYLAAFRENNVAAYLSSGLQFVPITRGYSSGRTVIVGPINSGMLTYTQDTGLTTTYKHAGGFSYLFEDNIVYKTDPPPLIPVELYDATFRPMATVNDRVINKVMLLKRDPYLPEKWHPSVIDLVDHAARVKLLLPVEEAQSGVASVLFQGCRTNDVVSPCKSFTGRSDYFTIPRGCHRTIVLYNNGTYLKMDSVELQSYYNIVVDLNTTALQPADSISQSWLTTAASHCFRSVTTAPRQFTFHNSYNTVGNVHGTILDDTNMPLPGATVIVKGTAIGAVSDVNGRFIIDVPDDPATLVFSFIGYMTKEIEVRPGSDVAAVMEPDITELQEVVVVGYGTVTKQDVVGAVSTLQGRVAGVTINPEKEEEQKDDQTENEEFRVEQEAERKLYEELMTLKNFRSQFSDVGFWEPRLFTDRHGKAKFTATLPDDITRWDAVVYGMNRQLQTGTARKSIKSYKPLMAELHVPQFLVVGDSSDFLAKVLNYTVDKTIIGKSKWDGLTSGEHDLTFESFHADKLPVIVTTGDTITSKYSFTRNDGYFDGEERKVPVIEQGTIRANGTLSMLKNNDELHLRAKKGEVIKMEILDNQLDVYAQDVRDLVNYKYDCNEQLASKLIGFLNYKLLMQYEGKPFKHDKDVNKIIQRLLKNQNEEFLWSWWGVSYTTSYWMSAHILRALKAAKDAGYAVNLNIENVTRKATYKYDFLKQISVHDVQILHALAMWDADIDYSGYVNILDHQIQYFDSIARAQQNRFGYTHYSVLNEKLMLLELRQLQKLPFVADSLIRYKKQTILNEVYFSDNKQSRYWHSADLASNSIAYRIIKRDSTLRHLTTAMQMYFLSLRRKGGWNTYEASNVLMSILPDLLADGTSKKVPASVLLKGKVNEPIQKFPYKAELTDGEELHLFKEAGLPLYCMQYKEERVTRAQAGTDAFKIKTAFSERKLKAGKPVILKVTVEIKRDASLEHVMIEIPIPGGCSYADKRQSGNVIETHREYFKEKTVVFCENMREGTYVFQVQLLPRFTGKYHVNPAQISLMYFPVINANTDMIKVGIVE